MYLFRLQLNIAFFGPETFFTSTNSAYPEEMSNESIHQFTSVKKICIEKYISQLKCSRLSFLKIFLVPYAFTGCNLRVGIRRDPKAFYRVHTL